MLLRCVLLYFIIFDVNVSLADLVKTFPREEAEIINQDCLDQLKIYGDKLESTSMYTNNWAWQMFDSSTKINSGILTGHYQNYGNYDECVGIDAIEENIKIKGKFCTGGVMIPLNLESRTRDNKTWELFEKLQQQREVVTDKMPIYIAAICLPDKCSPVDLVTFFKLPKEMANNEACQTYDDYKSFDAGDWAFIVFIIFILSCAAASTCYDMYLRKAAKKPVYDITLAFSFLTNGEKIFRTTNNPEYLNCLNGLRVFSIFWIMAGHRYSSYGVIPQLNILEALSWMEKPYSQYIQGAPLAVDAFIFITGVVMSYSFIQFQSKPNARFNVLLYYLHRYLRITPSVAVLYFFVTTIMRRISSGPVWPTGIDGEIDKCLEYWWSFFLYIQNYVNADKICLGHSWYLSLDMQIFLVSPLLLIPLVKYPKQSYYILCGVIVLSLVPVLVICYYYEVAFKSEAYDIYYNYKAYTRITPWCVGVLLGVILIKTKNMEVKIHPVLNLTIWAIVLIVMGLVQYFLNILSHSEYNKAEQTFFVATHRTFWSFGLLWIVFACHKGYGGFINWFLTLPLFEVIAKLTYSMYLFHFVILITDVYRKRTSSYFDDYEILNTSLADIVSVTFISIFWTLLFESPMIVIEKIIFKTGKKENNEVVEKIKDETQTTK